MRIYKTLSIDYACLVIFILFHIYIYIYYLEEKLTCVDH
jgi:hypothetical protein